jgi:DNA end-binding protein Ku
MGSRALWKAVIRFGSIAVPVKLYSAVQERAVHFRLLHEKDHTPVTQKMVNPNTGEVVPYEEIRRGYETKEGEIVLLEKEELEALEPPPSRDIEVLHFVDPGLISHQWYDRPYYLGPDTDPERYFALAESLEQGRMEGFARWTMRKKRYIGALLAEGGYLKMITLRFAEEVVRAADLPRPEGRPLARQELQMAEQLIRALEGDFNADDYRDEYRDRVRALVETKARGGRVELKRVREKKPKVVSLADLLKQSIERAHGEGAKERKIA